MSESALQSVQQFVCHNSLAALLADPAYQVCEPVVQDVLTQHEYGSFVRTAPVAEPYYRIGAWNLERGMEFAGIVACLREHETLRTCDVLLLTETDRGMARTSNRNVARELAEHLGMEYLFVPSYLNLAKGSGVEARAAGENREGLHGNAILSRYPLRDFAHVALPNGKDKMRGNEKRIGCQRAPVATVVFPQGEFRVVCAHLDAHATRAHRARQMRCIVDHVDESPQHALPTLIGGDWNTCTYNSHCARAGLIDLIKRLPMGARKVIVEHYPFPDRKFERSLFRLLEDSGFDYRSLNQPGVGTLYYDFHDEKQRINLEEMLPRWMFRILDWVTRCVNGRCALKLDWFAGRGVQRADQSVTAARGDIGAAQPPRVLLDVRHGGAMVSDHEPIVLDVVV